MNSRISAIKNDFQDRSSEAWKKLCEYVDHVAKEELKKSDHEKNNKIINPLKFVRKIWNK